MALQVVTQPQQLGQLKVVSAPQGLPTQPLKVQPVQQPQLRPGVIDATGAPAQAPRPDTSVLSEARKQQLRQIVGQMVQAGEPDQNIGAVVTAFTQKYGNEKPETYLGIRRDNYLDPQAVFGIGVGAVKGLMKTADTVSRFGQNVLGQTAGRLANILTGKGNVPTQIQGINPEVLKANNLSEKIGFGAERALEYLAPAGAGAKAQKAVQEVMKAGKAVRGLGFVANAATEAATTAGLSKAQGNSNKDAAISAAVAGAIPLVGSALQPIARKIQTALIKPTQADFKAGFDIANVKKYNLGGSLNTTAKKTHAMISKLSDQLTTMLKDSPARVDVLSALADAEKELAKSQAKNFGTNIGIKKALNTLAEELTLLSKDGTLTLAEANQAKRSIGKLGAWMYGMRDADANAMETVANVAYTKLKNAIQKAAPSNVAAINKQLSDLIPIENALVRRLPVAERSNLIGLTDLVSVIPSFSNFSNFWLAIANRILKSGTLGNVLSKTDRPLVQAGIRGVGLGTKEALQGR